MKFTTRLFCVLSTLKEQYGLRLFDKGEIDFYLERIKQELIPKQPILENRKM